MHSINLIRNNRRERRKKLLLNGTKERLKKCSQNNYACVLFMFLQRNFLREF